MKRWRHTYTGYSIACALVWAVIMGLMAVTGNKERQQIYGLVCMGWWLGWLSATIARAVYPPPRGRPGA